MLASTDFRFEGKSMPPTQKDARAVLSESSTVWVITKVPSRSKQVLVLLVFASSYYVSAPCSILLAEVHFPAGL